MDFFLKGVSYTLHSKKVSLRPVGFSDLSDQGDCLKASKGVTIIITSMLTGVRCFGSGLATFSAVKLCV